jgi:hypothetical protein
MADEIVAKYRVDVNDATSNLDKLAGKVADVDKETAKTSKGFKDLGANAVASVGLISPQVAAATTAFTTFRTAVMSMVVTLKTLTGALIATGLGALVVVLGSVAAYFASSEKAANRFKIIMAALGQVVETIGNLFEDLGEVIVNAFSNPTKALRDFGNGVKTYVGDQITNIINGVGLLGKAMGQLFARDFSGAMESGKQAVLALGEASLKLNPTTAVLIALGKGAKNLSADLQVSVAAAIKLQEAANKLAESDRALNVERANSRAQIKELQLAAADESLAIDVRIAKAKEAAAIEDALLVKRLKNGEEAVRIAKEEMRLTDDSAENLDKIAEAETNLAAIREESAGKQRRLLMQIQAIENQVQAKAKAAADERAKIEADALAEREKIAAQELKYSEETAKERVKIAEDMAQMLLDIERYLATTSEEIRDAELADIQRNYEKDLAFVINAGEEQVSSVEEQTAAIVLLEKERDKLIEQAEQDHSDRIFAINKELADKKAGLDAETAEAKQAQLERELQEFQQVAGAMQGLISAISNAQNSATENELNQLELALERGEITREEYDRKRKEAMRKNAEAQKQAAILAATVNLASAVVAALGTPPVGPFSIAMAALIGAAGLIEIGSIIATPVPQFAKGVVGLQGEGTATSDSIHAKLSKGESVITAKETSKHKGLLEAMNKGLAEKYILSNYVKPALDSVMLSGMSDIGKSAELNGLTANLKDHNIIAAMDRHRAADVAGFKMLAKELKGNKFNARKTW